eukprot:scaffold98234_cov41-Prasinocladus_malaysianus.AAC.5
MSNAAVVRDGRDRLSGMGNATKRLSLLAIQHGVRRLEVLVGPDHLLDRQLLGEAIRESGVPRRELYLTLAVDPMSKQTTQIPRPFIHT